MARMTVEMSDTMMRWVEEEAAERGHADAGAFLRELIDRVQVRKAKIAEMQRLVDEGRASGVSTRSIDDIWDDARRRAAAAVAPSDRAA